MNKILFVDDITLPLAIKRGLQSSARINFLIAGNNRDAVLVARRERPNLIVMNKQLPNIDVLGCCRTIKADPLLRHIPVIILTTTIKPGDFDEYLVAGCNDCLMTPFDGQQLLPLIKKYLPAIERYTTRVPLRTEVRLIGNDGFHVGMTRDVSPKGIYVTSQLQPLSGQGLQVSFVLPGCEVPTEVLVKVAWLRRKTFDAAPGFGAEFLEITGNGSPAARERDLEAFVALQAQSTNMDQQYKVCSGDFLYEKDFAG